MTKFLDTSASGIAHLSLSELHICQSYFQRLFYSALELSDVAQTIPMRSWAVGFNYQSQIHLKKFWLSQDPESIEGSETIQTLSVLEVRDNTKILFKTLEGVILLGLLPPEKFPEVMALTLNFLFLHARRLHLILKENTNLEIDLPRVSLMDTLSTQEGIPAYRIDTESIFDLSEDNDAPIRSLETQRIKKYDALIEKGHLLVSDKDYTLARESFLRALNFSETGEAYNLVGWTYSMEGEVEKAKQFCLKAIKTDPAYGASYNDLGSYLLSQGEIKESLKWFELAKNSRNYQNREYPYINAGRAHMMLREYQKALKEFAMALTLAPFNEELHETVTRLKETISKSEFKSDSFDIPSLKNNDDLAPSIF